MRRHRLVSLEKAGMVHEVHDCGYARAFSTDGVNEIPQSDDPLEDEKLRSYILKKAQETSAARARRMARLRKLARMDFKMIGGVAPIGFYGGAGGADGAFRPTSMSART